MSDIDEQLHEANELLEKYQAGRASLLARIREHKSARELLVRFIEGADADTDIEQLANALTCREALGIAIAHGEGRQLADTDRRIAELRDRVRRLNDARKHEASARASAERLRASNTARLLGR